MISTPTRDLAIEVRGLCKSFGGVRALRDLSFDLHAGEILGLIGPNGSGKSTTVNVLAGVFPPTAGRILLGGREVSMRDRDARLQIAAVFQRPYLFKGTVGDRKSVV